MKLKSERISLISLSFEELTYICGNELNKLEVIIEEDVLNYVELPILKKLKKMRNVSKDNYEWYTYWLIVDDESKRGIGFIGFKGLPDENGYTEIGYSISSNYRKRGLMTEALKTLIQWSRKFQYCKGITAKVVKNNTASIRVLNNCKFKIVSSSEKGYDFLYQ
ncbi:MULTISPECIES: GNAT family N-acetyltransferase [Clostridium]|uniref:GNAT family N-acetyltransferase n=1 Tax=Clostridium TaxID=1485 RepID=UPI00082496DE|nr:MULTISPECIES: GNAT family N-acetyltransferase [Clostridium]PJI09539.1 N-acetyltransferase [Clostridium sp. CT7]